jgi:16S rRNA (guanine1516-N2)-methyltransferase
MRYRAQHATLRKEALARAIGMKPQDHPLIIDATAGLGRDSFILAVLGFTVIMLERSPLIYPLLQDGLDRLRADGHFTSVAERLQLIQADAIEWLPIFSQQTPPDVIYLDPMFPERKKTAASKKDMTQLQHLLGQAQDEEQLFLAALACAARRVVVKRPRLAANMANRTPNFSLSGKSSRFDVYMK